jgi:hypothetical protein
MAVADGDAEGSDFLGALKSGDVHVGACLEEEMEGGHVARGCGAVVVGNREVVTSAGELVEGGGSGVAGAAGGEQDHTQEELEEAGCHGRWGRGDVAGVSRRGRGC